MMKISTINPVITDAKEARDYINKFCQTFSESEDKMITYVDTPTRRIDLIGMTDEDALFVANEFQNMTAEAAKRRGRRQ